MDRNKQTSKLELSAKIVSGLEPFTNFRKKLHPRYLIGLATPPNPLDNSLKIVIILKIKTLF